MKMQRTHHRRAPHVAARVYLVFCDFSSRVSEKQSGGLRSPPGLSGGALVRVLPSQATGRLSRNSSSKALCGVEGLERLSCEKNASLLYGQASCREAQTGHDEEWTNPVKSRDESLDR